MLETQVPLETLRQVTDIAIEIGREGREGKPVGALFVVGQHRKVLEFSHEQIHDPFRGYSRKERSFGRRACEKVSRNWLRWMERSSSPQTVS